MMMQHKKYKVGVFIGRFQPFHNGHLHVVKDARYNKNIDHIIFVLGSANVQDERNPYSAVARKDMIECAVPRGSYSFVFAPDFDTDKKWEEYIIKSVQDALIKKWEECAIKSVQEILSHDAVRREILRTTHSIALLGYKKDITSKYLDLFPDWKKDELLASPYKEYESVLSATDIRKEIAGNSYRWTRHVPEGAWNTILKYASNQK